MAEWLYEAGIGENRAALVANGRIWQARIEREGGGLRVGGVATARLVEILIPRISGRATLDGTDLLVEPLPAGITKGGTIRIRVVREAIAERGRMRLAKAVPAAVDAVDGPGPTLFEALAADTRPVRRLHPHEADALEEAGWSEVLEEAETGDIAFPGGALRMAVTPAMTLFDVDGPPPLGSLSIDAAHAVAQAIERHGIGGSIGIDFPTLSAKRERNAVAEAIDASLPQPFERTAVNGFGFLQIVRRRTRASLPELHAADPVGWAIRAALRRMERVAPGQPATHLMSEPLARALRTRPDWIAAVAQRTGRVPEIVVKGPE